MGGYQEKVFINKDKVVMHIYLMAFFFVKVFRDTHLKIKTSPNVNIGYQG